jgi:hypothetical protein
MAWCRHEYDLLLRLTLLLSVPVQVAGSPESLRHLVTLELSLVAEWSDRRLAGTRFEVQDLPVPESHVPWKKCQLR